MSWFAMGQNRLSVFLQAGLCLSPLIPVEAYSAVYLTEAQATAILFPGQTFTKSTLPLSADERAKIKERSDEAVRADNAVVWRATSGDWVFIDRVLGKHEFITYAVAIEKSGKVKGIEILEYRESYGHEVRGESWRAQFVGKNLSAPLKLNQDIHNISGATLSSAHITAGVRRVLQTYEILKSRT